MTHQFISDGTLDRDDNPIGCQHCPMPPGNAIHDVAEQTADAAAIDARVLGERDDE